MARRKTPRKRRSFTREFKAEAVRLCNVGGRSIEQVATDLDLTETSLREWVKRAGVDADEGPPGALTTQEREELRELRKRVKRLEMEREILKNDQGRSGPSVARETPCSYRARTERSDRLLFGDLGAR